MGVRLGFLSTYPATQCGIATFTEALTSYLIDAAAEVGVVRLVDEPEPQAFPVVHQWVAGSAGGAIGKIEQNLGHGRPGQAGLGVGGAVAVALLVADPTLGAAVGQCHGHVQAARGAHMAKGRGAQYRAQGIEYSLDFGQGEAWQQHRVAGQALRLRAEQVEVGLDHGVGVG